MIVDLVCLAWFAGVTTAAGVVIVRTLRRAPTTTPMVCLRCGAPAAALKSFDCPGCGHDVRTRGVGPARGHGRRATFAKLLLITAHVVVFGIAVSAAARVNGAAHHFFTLRQSPPGPSAWGRVVESIEMLIVGEWVDGGWVVSADAYVDLHLAGGGGEISVLHIDVPGGECDWTLPYRDHAEPQGTLTREVFDRWLAGSGSTSLLFTNTPDSDPVGDLYRQVRAVADGANPRGIPASRWSEGYWSGGGSIGVSRWHDRAAVTVWPTVWLAALTVFARRTDSRAVAAPPPAEVSA